MDRKTKSTGRYAKNASAGVRNPIARSLIFKSQKVVGSKRGKGSYNRRAENAVR
jgi:stalled ribosome alternative rescue factor ArfA